MNTTHRISTTDSSNLDAIDDESIDLVVTSPPYPMIEMWDDYFVNRDESVANAYQNRKPDETFNRMHQELNRVWQELDRVVKPSGIVCVNIGDATRKFDDTFELYPNHVKIIESFRGMDYELLPDILWRKPTNSANKFMGSGMIPPNAYVTLEHEYLLIFRKPTGPRRTDPNDNRRYASGYFWEERNRWFSDIWEKITGTLQSLDHDELRERAAAYPMEIPYRLINMFSIQGDKVLDPFWGTGTTTLAAIASGRHSLGREIEESLLEYFDERINKIVSITDTINSERYKRHIDFVEQKQDTESGLKYLNETYDIPVMTKQEKHIRLLVPETLTKTDSGYTISHETWHPNTREPGA